MSPPLTSRRPSADRHRPDQLCERHRAMQVSTSPTTGFSFIERRSTVLTMKDRPPTSIYRPTDTGLGRIQADTADSGRPATTTRQRRCRSAGALARMMSHGLRLLLVVAVLSTATDAQPLRAGEHLPRARDTTQRPRPPPFSVDTYDEAVVSNTFSTEMHALTYYTIMFNVRSKTDEQSA